MNVKNLLATNPVDEDVVILEIADHRTASGEYVTVEFSGDCCDVRYKQLALRGSGGATILKAARKVYTDSTGGQLGFTDTPGRPKRYIRFIFGYFILRNCTSFTLYDDDHEVILSYTKQ